MGSWIRGKEVQHPDGWQHWLALDYDDAEATSLGGLAKVRYLPGHTPLSNAAEQSARHPLKLHPDIAQRRPDGFERFISLAGWFQVGKGGGRSCCQSARWASCWACSR